MGITWQENGLEHLAVELMDYGMDNGMYSWWHHCVLDYFLPSFHADLEE